MKPWNMAGELHSPKNITIGLNRPFLVLKAAFHWSSSTIGRVLYPHRTSNFENHSFPVNLWTISSISGSGYWIGTVHLLSLW